MTYRKSVLSIKSLFFGAIVLLCGIVHGDDAIAIEPQEKPTSRAVWGDLTEADKRTLLAFLLQNDLGNRTKSAVTALLSANMTQPAVELVMRTYHVPKHTAELFVRFEALANGLDASDVGK